MAFKTKMLGAVKSVALATPSKSITDIREASSTFDPTISEYFSGAGLTPGFVITDVNASITFSTGDASILTVLCKGVQGTNAVITYKGAYDTVSSTTSVTSSHADYTATISDFYVAEAISIESSKEGAVYSVTLKLCQNATSGNDGTITFAAVSGGD